MKLPRSSAVEIDPAFEAEVRSVLRRSIVPPPVPDYVRYRVEAMDGVSLPMPRGPFARWRSPGLPGPWPRLARRHPAALRVAASLAVVLALAAGAAVWRAHGPTTAAAPTASAPVWQPGAMMLPQLAPNGAGYTYIDGTGLFVTADYGATWSGPRQIPAGDSPQDHLWDLGTLDFIDAQHGWMTGVTNDVTGSKVTEYRTDDGGRTWKAKSITAFNEPATQSGSEGSFVFATQHFVDQLHGRLAVGRVSGQEQPSACSQWLTLDGGQSWVRTDDADPCFVSPKWVTPELGYVTNEPGALIWVTQDGGASWRSGELTGPWSGLAPSAILPGAGGGLVMIARDNSVSCGTGPAMSVFGSTDGGVSWRFSYDLNVADMTGGGCLPDVLTYGGAGRWTALTGNSLRESRDGGRTWTLVGTSPVNSPQPQGLAWWDERHGILRGNTVSCGPASSGADCNADVALFITSDGGRTWQQVRL